MKLQVGDIVRYLNAVGGGTVTKVLNENLVEIHDESGFDMPVRVQELVLVERPNTPKKETVAKITQSFTETVEEVEDEEIEGNDNPHLFVAFVRNSKDSAVFETYLINDCNYNLLYVLYTPSEELSKCIASGMLEANAKIKVADLSYDAISKLSKVQLQGILYKNKPYASQSVFDAEVAINPVKFYKPGVFVVNDFFDEDAYVIELYDAEKVVKEQQREQLRQVNVEEIREAMVEKQKSEENPKPQVKKNEESVREVDLHIGELVDNEETMSPAEKLDLQVKTFERELTKAVKDGIEKIVFIHGVGNGILKAKIRGCLDRDYPQYYYQDASFQKYKFGATLVYLRKVYR